MSGSTTYYEYRDVKVKIAHRLFQMDGWKVYGYSPDNSDPMTDYYDPAYWNGIATKNGFTLVVDRSDERTEDAYTTKRTTAAAKIDRETADKISKLERMTQANGASEQEEQTARAAKEFSTHRTSTAFTNEKTIISMYRRHAMYFTTILDSKPYTITATDTHLIIQDDTIPAGQPCKKSIKVEDDSTFTYKVLKTKIRARGGAKGLYAFLNRCYIESFMTCNANEVLRSCIYKIKEA